MTGWAAEDRRPAVVADVRAEPRFRWLDGVDQEAVLVARPARA